MRIILLLLATLVLLSGCYFRPLMRYETGSDRILDWESWHTAYDDSLVSVDIILPHPMYDNSVFDVYAYECGLVIKTNPRVVAFIKDLDIKVINDETNMPLKADDKYNNLISFKASPDSSHYLHGEDNYYSIDQNYSPEDFSGDPHLSIYGKVLLVVNGKEIKIEERHHIHKKTRWIFTILSA